MDNGQKLSKKAYLSRLSERLTALPEAERRDTVYYYSEYFEEAGPENEAAIMEELGPPEALAKKILSDFDLRQKTAESAAGALPEKKKRSAWTWVLFILALPIIAPIFLGLAGAAFGIAMGFLGIGIGIAAAIGSLLLVGIAGVVVGVAVVFTHPGTGLIYMGLGLASAGLFALILLPLLSFVGSFFRFMGNTLKKLFLKLKNITVSR